MIDVRVLGPVEAVDSEGRRLALGGPKPTGILLTLALADGASVSTDRLIEELWGSAPPRSAVDTLQSHLSRLRRALEPGRGPRGRASVVERDAGGYRLVVQGVRTDLRRFEDGVGRGRQLLAADRTSEGVEELRAALACWRGGVGQGMQLGPIGRAAEARLEELRLTVTEERLVAELSLGRHAELVGELEALLAEHPVRERMHGLLMVALYRSGRQAEALEAFRQARTRLIEMLGVEPGPQLHELHERILLQDPTLETEPAGPPGGGSRPEGPGPGRSPGRDVRPPGNLPAPLIELIGRDGQRADLARTLETQRLVTLTGAGGCGKTQLALRVARDVRGRFADGVWLVELQSRRDPDLVADAVAEVLGVGDVAVSQVVDAVTDRLRLRRALLVLDNCEHVIDGCAALVRELLLRCPDLRVLATSRQPLDVDGEVAWRVPSLSLPPAGATLTELADSDAAQLFVQRAAAVRQGFTPTVDDAAAIATICRALDGIPLAIELAAARLRVLSAEELAERLDDRFSVLRSSRRGAPPRHRTLEAAIAWSFELLDPPAQRLLLQLAVFEGAFTVAATEAVCGEATGPDRPVGPAALLEGLEGLVDRSLVLTIPTAIGPARHDLLQTIRAFARSRLDPGELERLRGRHARWFADLADTAAARLTGADQVRWLNQLHADHDDLRAALSWSLERGERDLALRIVGGVWWFWLQFGHAREGVGWLERVLDDAGDEPDPALLQGATHGLGRLLAAIGRTDDAQAALRRSAALAEALDAPGARALSLVRLAPLLRAEGDHVAARRALDEARAAARTVDDPWVHASVADVAGELALADADPEAAAAAFGESERRYLDAGDRWSACLSRHGLAWVARRRGDGHGALRLHGENLRAIRALTRSQFDFVGLARDLRGVAAVASGQGRDELAARLCGASEDLRQAAAVALTPDERAEVAEVLARSAQRLGDEAAAAAQAAGRSLTPGAALAEAVSAVEELVDAAADGSAGSSRAEAAG